MFTIFCLFASCLLNLKRCQATALHNFGVRGLDRALYSFAITIHLSALARSKVVSSHHTKKSKAVSSHRTPKRTPNGVLRGPSP